MERARNGASPARRGSWEGGEEERRAEARLQGLAASLTPPLAVGSEGRGRACADSKRPQGFRKRAGICDGQVRADPRGGQRRLRVSPGALGRGTEGAARERRRSPRESLTGKPRHASRRSEAGAHFGSLRPDFRSQARFGGSAPYVKPRPRRDESSALPVRRPRQTGLATPPLRAGHAQARLEAPPLDVGHAQAGLEAPPLWVGHAPGCRSRPFAFSPSVSGSSEQKHRVCLSGSLGWVNSGDQMRRGLLSLLRSLQNIGTLNELIKQLLTS